MNGQAITRDEAKLMLLAVAKQHADTGNAWQAASIVAAVDALASPAPAIDMEQLRVAVERVLEFTEHHESCGDADSYNNAEIPSCGCGLDGAKESLLALIDDSKNNNLPHVGDINVVVSQPSTGEGRELVPEVPGDKPAPVAIVVEQDTAYSAYPYGIKKLCNAVHLRTGTLLYAAPQPAQVIDLEQFLRLSDSWLAQAERVRALAPDKAIGLWASAKELRDLLALIDVQANVRSSSEHSSEVAADLARIDGQAEPRPLIARQLAEWHEDDGPAMWWAWCGSDWAGEPAWCGTPNDSDWPSYHTHWTPHPAWPMQPSKG